MLVEGLFAPDDFPPGFYRASLPDWAIQAARHMFEVQRMPVTGDNGITAHLGKCGLDVGAHQIFYVKKMEWKLCGRRGLPTKFDAADLGLVLDISLNAPRITRQGLSDEFARRTLGLVMICPTWAWEIAVGALKRLPPKKTPILTLGHRAARELSHQMLLDDIHILPHIEWSDETMVLINPTIIKGGQRVFCLGASDPARNVPVPQAWDKIMVHGMVSLEHGSCEPVFFTDQEAIGETVYADLINTHIRPWLEAHPDLTLNKH